jgi:hypothetical protein
VRLHPMIRVIKASPLGGRVKISQREARRLRKRVAELEAIEAKRFGGWATSGYPGGIHLASRKIDTDGWLNGTMRTARRLGCVLVCTIDDAGEINYYAVKK